MSIVLPDQFVEESYKVSNKIKLVAYASQQLKPYKKDYLTMIGS